MKNAVGADEKSYIHIPLMVCDVDAEGLLTLSTAIEGPFGPVVILGIRSLDGEGTVAAVTVREEDLVEAIRRSRLLAEAMRRERA